MSRFSTGVLVIAVILGLALMPVVSQAGTTIRPLSDFLSQQGQPIPPQFVPPDPNFLGWSTNFALPVIYFAGVDYAGLAPEAYAAGQTPQISGTVVERTLADGRAEVTVLLQTRGANAWVIQLDLSGDILDQIANKATLFGHRPRDVAVGAGQALADTTLRAVFTISAPGAPLPDLVLLNGTPDLKFLSFYARGKGPLTAEFGVAEGTPGKCTIVQTGLLAVQGKANDHSRVAFDAFPAENIDLKVVGK